MSAYSITGATQPLSFLSQITNTSPSSGGTDAETFDQTITRGLIQLRLRNLVSADDYESAAEIVMGQGSVAKAIGLLGRDGISTELGSVHLFLLSANRQPANQAQLDLVKSNLSTKIQLGTQLYVSPMQLLNISGDITARVVTGSDVNTVIDDLWSAYQDYLNPSTYPVGQDIILNEVEYQLRLTGGIKNIQTLLLNGSPSNIPVANSYTVPFPYSLYIHLVDDNGVVYEVVQGAGEIPTSNL